MLGRRYQGPLTALAFLGVLLLAIWRPEPGNPRPGPHLSSETTAEPLLPCRALLLDVFGAAVSDATVQLGSFEGDLGSVSEAMTSVGDGLYSVRTPPGQYTLRATHDVWGKLATPVEFATDSLEVECRYTPGATVLAQIRRPPGQPVESLEVSRQSVPLTPHFEIKGSVPIDTCSIVGLAPGCYQLLFRAGSRDYPAAVEVPNNFDPVYVELDLTQSSPRESLELVGFVLLDGNPLPNRSVHWRVLPEPEDGFHDVRGSFETDSSGRFRFTTPSIRPLHSQVTFSYVEASDMPLMWPDVSDNMEYTICFRATELVSAFLRDHEGTPVANCWVSLGSGARTRTDLVGGLKLPAGSYALTADIQCLSGRGSERTCEPLLVATEMIDSELQSIDTKGGDGVLVRIDAAVDKGYVVLLAESDVKPCRLVNVQLFGRASYVIGLAQTGRLLAFAVPIGGPGLVSHLGRFEAAEVHESGVLALGQSHRVRWQEIPVRDTSGRAPDLAWIEFTEVDFWTPGAGDDFLDSLLSTYLWDYEPDRGVGRLARAEATAGTLRSTVGRLVIEDFSQLKGPLVVAGSGCVTGRLVHQDPGAVVRASVLGWMEVHSETGVSKSKLSSRGGFCADVDADSDVVEVDYVTPSSRVHLGQFGTRSPIHAVLPPEALEINSASGWSRGR
ncbi:MAG: hypothetical protein AB7O52_16655 [Planctomycetota bacterium]